MQTLNNDAAELWYWAGKWLREIMCVSNLDHCLWGSDDTWDVPLIFQYQICEMDMCFVVNVDSVDGSDLYFMLSYHESEVMWKKVLVCQKIEVTHIHIRCSFVQRENSQPPGWTRNVYLYVRGVFQRVHVSLCLIGQTLLSLLVTE